MRLAAPPIVRVYRDAFSGLPREVWLLCLAMLVNRAGMMVLPFLTLYLTQRLEFSATQAGQIMSLFGLGSMAGSWIGGTISDRFDPNRVQVVSLTLAGVFLVVLGEMQSFVGLGVAIVLVAIFGDAFRPALFVSAMRYSKAEVRPRTFAVLRLASSVGMTIGPAVGGWLAVHHYQWLFWGDAATCVAAAILLVVTLGAARGGSASGHAPVTGPIPQPLRDGPFLLFLLGTLLLGMVFFQLFSTWPLHLKGAYGLSEKEIGAILALNALLVALFEILLVRMFEDRNLLRLIGLGSFLTCLGMGAITFGPPVAMGILAMLMWTVGEMFALPMMGAVAAHRAGDAGQGRYMGLFSFTFSVALVLAPIVGTTVYERVGPETLWYGIMVLGIPLGLGFCWLSKALEKERTRDGLSVLDG